MSRFGTDSRFYAALTMAAELVIVNVLIVVTGLPVITAGAALTAGFAVCLQLLSGTARNPLRQFFATWRVAWAPATAAWLIFLALGLLLAWEWSVASQLRSTALSLIVHALLGLVGMLVLLTGVWFFPLLARRALTRDPIGLDEGARLLRTALLASLKYLPRTLIALAVVFAPTGLALASPELGARVLLWNVIIGIALACYLVVLAFRTPLGVRLADDSEHPSSPSNLI